MKLICPRCNNTFDLAEAVREAQHVEVADIAARFGKHWQIVYEYTDCFRQSEFGPVALAKRLRLLKEVWHLFDVLVFSAQGKRYRTGWTDILAAMTEICNANKWGFRNHNYLKAILKKTAERVSVEGLTAKEEQEREDSRQNTEDGRQEKFMGLSAEERRQKILGIIKNIGSKT